MSGNETTGIHNFFEENSSHQSQVAGSGSVVSNSNSWIDAQGINRVTSSSDRTDSDQRNVRLPIQTPVGIGLSQFSLKQHFDAIQSQNQQLKLNELMHASTTLHGRSGQAKFQGDGAVPNNLSLMQRGLANFGSQDGNSHGYGAGFSGNLEKPEVQESPVNFNFVRNHQQLSNQHPKMLQPQQRQQQASNDMQWKQHFIAMHMQEIQRQQELQQLHLGARHHNSFNQIYGATGQGGADDFPAMLSGMPVANVVNYMPVELMGFQSKSSSSSHMLSPGNMSWSQRNMPVMPGMPNGLIYSQDQGQPMHSMGYIPRQLDESLRGTPVSGSMGSLNHYFQLQGIPNDNTSVDFMSKLGENHTERTSMQSSVYNEFHSDQHSIPNEGHTGASFVAGRQGAHPKGSFSNTLIQDRNNGAVFGSIQQSNHLTEGIHVHEFHDGQRQNDWLGKSHERIATEVAHSHGGTTLDPTEEKILFGVDDGADISLGGSSRVAGTYLNGYPMQNNDSLSVFPSIQSGTWSALVQEALDASSSDTGQQEEWSGLCLQKTEPQVENHFVLLGDNGKQNALRDAESNLHISSPLRSKSFPFLSDTASQSCHSMPSSEQAIKYTFEQNERIEPNHSVLSVHQLPKENNDAQFSQNYQPYNFIGNSFEEGKQQLNASDGVWAVQEHHQAMHPMDSVEMGSNSRRMQESWIHQHKMPVYNMNSQSQLSNKLGGWGAESPSSSGSRNFKTEENSDLNQYARSNEVNTTMHMEMTDTQSLGRVGESRGAAFCSLGGPETVKSESSNRKMSNEHSYVASFADFMNPNSFRSNMVVNQQLRNGPPVHPLKHVTGHPFVKDKETNSNSDTKQQSACLQKMDNSPSYANNESSEAHGHTFSHLNTKNDTVRNNGSDSLLTRNDHFHFTSSGQKLSNQSDQKSLGSRKFQYHPMGNLEINMELANRESNKSHPQDPAHPMIWGLKNQEREKLGNSHLAEHVSSCNPIDVGRECYMDSRKNSSFADIPTAGTVSGHNPAIPSFSTTMAHYSQEKRIGIPSQDVPILFDKLNQSDDSSSAVKLNNSENISSGIPEGVASDGPVSSPLQLSQLNPLQGSGLKLAHPSQRQLGNSLPMHTLAEGTRRTWSSSTTSAAVLPTIHETSQRENLDYRTVMSPQASKDASYSNTKGSSSGMLHNTRNQPLVQQQQQQSVSYASRQRQFDQCASHSFGNKVAIDTHPMHLHDSLAQGLHDGSSTNETSQALFPNMPGKVPDSRLNFCTDDGATTNSQIYSQDSGNSEMKIASTDQRNISQLHQGVETVSANESSAAPIASQQGHYSNIFNNVWRNASSQQPSGIQPQKFPANLLQSMNHLQPPQQDDRRLNRGGNSSEVGACSINSQQFMYGEDDPLKGSSSEQKHPMGMDVSLRVASSIVQGQESKNLSDKSSAVSVSPSVRLHLHDNKNVNNADRQRENANFTTASPSNSDISKYNYSLLQQMQAMKGIDSDPSKFASKRLKMTYSACGELDAGSQSRDVKMPSFSSKVIEERSTSASTHPIVGELASCRTASSPGQHELQSSPLRGSVFSYTAANERLPINPQMAPSWFDQYETYKDSQTSGMSDSLISSQSAKAAAQNYLFSKTLEQVEKDATLKRIGDSISENSSPTAVAADSHSHQKQMVTDENLVPMRKKRKVVRLDLPWHNEVTKHSGSLQSFSMAKIKWAQATNRLIEKIEDDNETIDSVPSIILSRKRLILTTQLIQHIFPSVPAKLLFEDSMTSFEKVIYYLAKVTLAEACNTITSLESGSGLPLESKNMISEKLTTPRKMREEFFSNIVENFITRLRKLQSNFSRLEGGSSIVDYRMECQDVERVSIINRFAKFHGRGPTEGVDGSSTLETAPRRIFPQRNVYVLPMPRNIPDGVNCLSL